MKIILSAKRVTPESVIGWNYASFEKVDAKPGLGNIFGTIIGLEIVEIDDVFHAGPVTGCDFHDFLIDDVSSVFSCEEGDDSVESISAEIEFVEITCVESWNAWHASGCS